jgi:hypothetical protein
MNIKRYTLSYASSFDLVVEINHDIMTTEKLHEINNFWSGAKDRLAKAKGDILKAVLTGLAMTAFRMTITEWNAINEFKVKGVEGWPLLDGSEGMTLVSLDDFVLDEDEVTIKEAT